MYQFLPTIYVPNIYQISYQKLKKQGIKYLIFDLDNTIGKISEETPSQKTRNLFNQLKKDFTIIIVSNNVKKRVASYVDSLDVCFFSFAMKPSCRALRAIRKKFSCNKNEMIVIGDQLVTDILYGNRFHIKTILVDPLGTKDLKITGINRKIETKILKKYQKLGILERGKYYE